MINKRLLIFSNNALSESSSNGRTLKNLLGNDSAENLAQFYLQPSLPDFNCCKNYFFVSDSAVLKAFFKRKSAGKVMQEKDFNVASSKEKSSSVKKSIPRNPLTMIIRNFFWNRKAWRKKFQKWIEEFNPQVILFHAGDAPFLYKMSLYYAKKYNLPMIIYNSEDYYFKDYNYFRDGGITAVFYPLFRRKLKKAVEQVLNYATASVYITEDLQKVYDEEFNKKSYYIYTATDVECCPSECENPIFSYLGNLGIDRHIGLVKIANALAEINPQYKLDVYGKVPNEKVKNAFNNCPALNYKGLVSYERVEAVMGESLLLFHTESTDPFYCKDVCHGFSTKIADSLASGRCFVIFAPEMLSCTKYIKENECGVVITEEHELKRKIQEVLENDRLRTKCIKNALEVVEKNHRADTNKAKMEKIINDL